MHAHQISAAQPSIFSGARIGPRPASEIVHIVYEPQAKQPKFTSRRQNSLIAGHLLKSSGHREQAEVDKVQVAKAADNVLSLRRKRA
jgi:hypothetical protein